MSQINEVLHQLHFELFLQNTETAEFKILFTNIQQLDLNFSD